MCKLKEMLLGATNVYRTKDFIVKQCINIKYNKEENNALVSNIHILQGIKLVIKNIKRFLKIEKILMEED